jgi:hypothetical protein
LPLDPSSARSSKLWRRLRCSRRTTTGKSSLRSIDRSIGGWQGPVNDLSAGCLPLWKRIIDYRRVQQVSVNTALFLKDWIIFGDRHVRSAHDANQWISFV